MTFPTPFTVQRMAYVQGAVDDRGNNIDEWLAPVDVEVHGWAPPSPDDVTIEVGREPIDRDLDLYVPTGTVATPKDHWAIPGQPIGHCTEHPDSPCFEQQGHIQDFSYGPFGFDAGCRIKLNRVEG